MTVWYKACMFAPSPMIEPMATLPSLVDGVRRWVAFDDSGWDDSDFVQLGADLAHASGLQREGQVGRAPLLLPQRVLVDYAVGAWSVPAWELTMIRIGLVDLDNSHPVAYTPILQRMDDLRVTAVYDHGDVQSPEFVLRFAQVNGIEHVCQSLAELVEAVDVALLHGQNWDKHVERARPFLEAGKPVFIDKPMVGRRRDAEALLALAERTGTPVMGGSALRFANEVASARTERAGWGRIYSAYLCGPGDFFNFGSHFMAVAGGFFGSRVEAVTWLGQGDDDLFMLEQRGEGPLVVQLAAGMGYPQHPCYLALATGKGMQVVAPQGATVAEATMREFAQFARSRKAPVPLDHLLDDSLSLVMAAHARLTQRRVTPYDLPLDAGFDGAAFTATFAEHGGYVGTGLAKARAEYVPS